MSRKKKEEDEETEMHRSLELHFLTTSRFFFLGTPWVVLRHEDMTLIAV